jgi:2-polyprenyl-3-methyl-5-hydroxy-6-metoxy-1,4-benzoquinol methylase
VWSRLYGRVRDDTCGVSECCNPRGCDELFGSRYARRVAKRYRKHGLDTSARRMVGFLDEGGILGATVLEIGGGIGEIQIELLKRGAAQVVSLELVDGYDAEAWQLLREAGLQDRVQRRRHDIAADPDGVERADVVVLHRVVCCYPDYERLLAAAAEHARRLLVFSYPRHSVLGRLAIAVENAFFKARRKTFRTFNHPPDAMLGVLAERGLTATYAHRGLAWQVAGLER